MIEDTFDNNKNNENNQSQIINLSSTNDEHDEIKLDSLQNTILLIDDKDKMENTDISKESSIIKLEENQKNGMDILFDLVNNNGLDKIMNYLCKDNLDTETEIGSKINLLRNKYGDLKLIFMILKLNLDYRKQKNNNYINKNEMSEIYNNKNCDDVFNFGKIMKNEEFQNNLVLFKNKINELLFSDLGFDLKKRDKNQSNNIIPKYFRDKIHSIEKKNGNFQKCVSCCENEKINYFCKNCKIPLHPECFTNYHNNHVYNENFGKNQKV